MLDAGKQVHYTCLLIKIKALIDNFMSVVSAIVSLILIMNPIGNLPVFLSTLKPIATKYHTKIIIREVFFAYILLTIFMFFGKFFLHSVRVSEEAVGIAGGIITFLVAIRMIFIGKNNSRIKTKIPEPFITPLATPLTAGPGSLTTVMLFVTHQPDKKFIWLAVITCASITVGIILLCGRCLSNYLGEKGLTALEKLSGMMLSVTATQMFLTGINSYFKLID
jgi:MarC family membrane protein